MSLVRRILCEVFVLEALREALWIRQTHSNYLKKTTQYERTKMRAFDALCHGGKDRQQREE